MIRVFEAFAGYGSQRMALDNLGIEHEVVAISEIDKFAIKSYEAIHGETNNLGDITKIDVDDVPDHDLFTYSFPCFTKDNLVLTDKGYKAINEVEVGDRVLTHKNTFEKVVKTFDNGIQPTVKVNAMGVDEIITTPNHRFYIRERKRVWNNKRRSYDRVFSEPDWKEIKDVKRNSYLGMAINQERKIPTWDGITFDWTDGRKSRHKNDLNKFMDNEDFWWVIGRYLADGWTRTQGGIVFGIGKEKSEAFEEKIGKLFNYSITEERAAMKYHVPLKELEKFVEPFGKGAVNKRLTNDILDLPVDLLESFLDGYFAGDGSYTQGRIKATSVSHELLLGIGQAVMKVYKRPYSLHRTNVAPTTVIEGRIVNQKTIYQLVLNKETNKQDQAFYESGYVWFPFYEITDNGKENVYDIEVENAHSFTVQNTIVHNCQDISVAGRQEGFDKGSGTRSGLLWECERVITNKKPKYLLMENVKNLVGKKFMKGFQEWIDYLESVGYTNYWKVLNAKDYGIPQNRERVFMVSILGEHEPFEFPKPIKLEKRLKDVLEPEVDEKFYLSTERSKQLISTITDKNKLIEPKLRQVARYDTETRKNSNRFRTYDPDGISPALSTMGGGGLEPHIPESKIAASRGRNKENPSDRTKGIELEQRLEVNENGTSNTLTTVQKDNYVLEPCNNDNYESELTPKKEFGRMGEQAVETQNKLKLKHGETLNSWNKRQSSRDGVVPTLTTRPEGFKTAINVIDQYRIRKLTPLECWRLMGVKDELFYKAQEVNSNSQLYKQAGNSIVVQVLERIFEKMFNEEE